MTLFIIGLVIAMIASFTAFILADDIDNQQDYILWTIAASGFAMMVLSAFSIV